MMIDLEHVKTWAPMVISLASLGVAASSWILSFQNFRRDSGRLDVSISLGDIVNVNTLASEAKVIHIKVVNSGRRPVLTTSIGGDYNGTWWRTALGSILTKTFLPTSFLFTGPKIDPLYMDQNRQFKLLTEGQISSVTIPIETSTADLTNMFRNTKSFYVTDTIGRKHFASCTVLSKFKNDLIAQNNEQGPASERRT